MLSLEFYTPSAECREPHTHFGTIGPVKGNTSLNLSESKPSMGIIGSPDYYSLIPEILHSLYTRRNDVFGGLTYRRPRIGNELALKHQTITIILLSQDRFVKERWCYRFLRHFVQSL